jgi:predicted ATPase
MQWKTRMLEAVGQNGKVLIDVIPEVELILGPQPDLQPLPSRESQNRFTLVFLDFIKMFATQEHPLVVFLDDLQWADHASLHLLESVLSDPELRYFFLLGTYRTHDVDKSHPFAFLCKRLKHIGLPWTDMTLEELPENAVTRLLSDSLSCKPSKVSELGRSIHAKTVGNPFFILQFLKFLFTEHFLVFNDGWQWDLSTIERANITDNVVELMANKINELQESSLSIMKVACCIGPAFSLFYCRRWRFRWKMRGCTKISRPRCGKKRCC